MSIESGLQLPFSERIRQEEQEINRLEQRLGNGEADPKLLRTYFQKKNTYYVQLYRTNAPDNPHKKQKVTALEAKRYADLLRADPSAWAGFCDNISNELKVQAEQLESEKKGTIETQAENWSQLSQKLKSTSPAQAT